MAGANREVFTGQSENDGKYKRFGSKGLMGNDERGHEQDAMTLLEVCWTESINSLRPGANLPASRDANWRL